MAKIPKWALVVSIIMAVGILFAVIGSFAGNSPAERLARVQDGNQNPPQEDIQFFQKRLDKIMPQCQEKDESLIADHIVSAWNSLRESKINLPLSGVAESVAEAVSGEPSPINCSDRIDAWVALEKNSHP